jgi:hypothetical protein
MSPENTLHPHYNGHLMLLTETITIYSENLMTSMYTIFGRNLELEQGIYVAI